MLQRKVSILANPAARIAATEARFNIPPAVMVSRVPNVNETIKWEHNGIEFKVLGVTHYIGNRIDQGEPCAGVRIGVVR